MEILKEKIRKEGRAINEHVLKVDSFLNHQVDSNLMEQIGDEFANYFRDKNITKVVTIESSGIAPAIMTAKKLNCDLVILKKKVPNTLLDGSFYQTPVTSFTKGNEYNLTLSKGFIKEGEKVLIIDDFLANGEAASGAIRILKEAKAEIVGIGIVIEKSFQPGRNKLEEQGFDIYSLARIKKLSEGKIEFVGE